MTRVYVVVEGQTEEAFVNELLNPALNPAGVYLHACLIGRPGHKGGRVSYARLRGDVSRFLAQERAAYCTTLVDYYGRGSGFPFTTVARPAASAVTELERAILNDLAATLPDGLRVRDRFLPYFQLHEWEALLFSDPSALAKGIYRDDLAVAFAGIASAFATPEDINDDPQTAPSKRIERLRPGYAGQKPFLGTLAALSVGLPAMRRACPRFGRWVDRLAALAGGS